MKRIYQIRGKKWQYIDATDLSESHIKKTIESYDKGAIEYAEEWEWSDKVQQRTKRDYLFPFIEETKIDDSILVVGSGTGRDLMILHSRRYQCLGIDKSSGMLEESVKRGVTCPLVNEDIMTFRGVRGSFDGILCESALEHIQKAKLQDIFHRFCDWLRYDGVLLMRIRMGDGRVFRSWDKVGERFFTSYTEDEIKRIVNKNGKMKVISTHIDPHIDPTRPSFYSILFQRL